MMQECLFSSYKSVQRSKIQIWKQFG